MMDCDIYLLLLIFLVVMLILFYQWQQYTKNISGGTMVGSLGSLGNRSLAGATLLPPNTNEEKEEKADREKRAKIILATRVKGPSDCKDPNFPYFDPDKSTCVQCFE